MENDNRNQTMTPLEVAIANALEPITRHQVILSLSEKLAPELQLGEDMGNARPIIVEIIYDRIGDSATPLNSESPVDNIVAAALSNGRLSAEKVAQRLVLMPAEYATIDRCPPYVLEVLVSTIHPELVREVLTVPMCRDCCLEAAAHLILNVHPNIVPDVPDVPDVPA